jgi:hypothetical protein
MKKLSLQLIKIHILAAPAEGEGGQAQIDEEGK